MIYENSLYRESISLIASEIPVCKGNILITGATGLIGACLTDIFAYCNMNRGTKFKVYALGRNRRKLNNRFGYCKDIEVIPQNVVDEIRLDGIDYIIHAASNADPESYALYPAETIVTNVLGARNVLELAKTDQARVLLISTFEVYGIMERDEYRESDFGVIDGNQLRSSYPESKRTAELLFRSYNDEYGVDGVIAHLSSIYGPTMLKRDSKAHAQFLRNALAGENIVLKSKGEQIRSYCYVLDAVSGLLKVLFDGERGEAYNVANMESVSSIAGLADRIAKIADTKVVFKIPHELERKGFSNPQNCILNTEKINALGWRGKYSLNEGLIETITILRQSGDEFL